LSGKPTSPNTFRSARAAPDIAAKATPAIAVFKRVFINSISLGFDFARALILSLRY
jgi:hypothetical protein